jgi:hypothetical protein
MDDSRHSRRYNRHLNKYIELLALHRFTSPLDICSKIPHFQGFEQGLKEGCCSLATDDVERCLRATTVGLVRPLLMYGDVKRSHRITFVDTILFHRFISMSPCTNARGT